MKLIICNNICLQQLFSVIIRGKTSSHVPLCFCRWQTIVLSYFKYLEQLHLKYHNVTFLVSVYAYKA